MRLNPFLHTDSILHGFEAVDRADAFRLFARTFVDRGLTVESSEALEQWLTDREEGCTTAIGGGVAIPHATIPDLSETHLLIAVSASPVPWGEDECSVFFVLLSPPGGAREHIRLLARISRLVRHPGLLEELRGAASAADVLEAVQRVDSARA